MNKKIGLIPSILIASALNGVVVVSAHASCENTSPSSRLNPTELSDHGKCWLKKHRPEKESGLAGDLFFVQAPNGDYFSMPVKTLAQMSEEKAIELVSVGVVEMIQQDVQEIGKVAAASQELEDLRGKINRKQERLKALRKESSDLQLRSESLRAERDALEAALTGEDAAQSVTLNEPEVEELTGPSILELEIPATEIDAPVVLAGELPDQTSLSVDGTPTETAEGTPTEEVNRTQETRLKSKKKRLKEIEERYASPANEDLQKAEDIELLQESLNRKDNVIAKKNDRIARYRNTINNKNSMISLLRDNQDTLLRLMSESKAKLHAEIDNLNKEVKSLQKELAVVRKQRKKLIKELNENDLTKNVFVSKSDDEIRRQKGLPSQEYFTARRNQNLKAAGESVFDMTAQPTVTTTVSLNETPVYASKAAFTDVFTATPIEEENSNVEIKLSLRECDCELVGHNAGEALDSMEADDFLNGEFENAVLITNPDLSSLDDDEASQKPTSVLTAAMGFKKNSEGEYDIENLVPANDTSNKVKLKSDHGIDLIFKNEKEANSFFAAVEASVEESVATAVSKAREAYKQGYRDGFKAGYAEGFVDGYRQAEEDYGIGR